jgi:hypothetical protein
MSSPAVSIATQTPGTALIPSIHQVAPVGFDISSGGLRGLNANTHAPFNETSYLKSIGSKSIGGSLSTSNIDGKKIGKCLIQLFVGGDLDDLNLHFHWIIRVLFHQISLIHCSMSASMLIWSVLREMVTVKILGRQQTWQSSV